MASQQIIFAETAAALRKALKRKAYESDSDSEIENHGNRGFKLKKRAQFAHQGQLVSTQGPSAYKEAVELGGTMRAIIHRNPPLVDEEGYELDSDDDDDQMEEAILAAAELNPYANIRLENLLAPLTASTDLPNHPTLSKPFVCKTLTNLVAQSCDLVRRENKSLWRIRLLWTSLCGDGVWMPCGLMVGPNDVRLYSEDYVARHLKTLASRRSDSHSLLPGVLNDAGQDDWNQNANEAQDNDGDKSRQTKEPAGTIMIDREPHSHGADKFEQDQPTVLSTAATEDKPGETHQDDGGGGNDRSSNQAANQSREEHHGSETVLGAKYVERQSEDRRDSKMRDADGSTSMRDDAEMTGNKASSAASDASGQTFIHPLFLTPEGAKLDRNLGLPEHEAEDIRRLLALYVQKQEEICRGATRLHHGLLKAERLRKDVLHWSKAEAHCGTNRDMSDGEDWYDKEEWGLTEDLKKGQDEEEEDTTTASKKTRNRR